MTPIEVVRRFTERMSALDGEGALECLSEDIRLENMLLPGFAEPAVQGRDVVEKSMRWGIKRFARWDIEITDVYEITDPTVVITEWTSEGVLHTGEVYENRYIHVFRVVDDRITIWREFAHPEQLELFLGRPPG